MKRILSSLTLIGILSACGGGGTPNPSGIASIALSCVPVRMNVGSSGTCTASAKAENGSTINPQPSFNFVSSDPSKVTVSGGGAISGVAAGISEITARAGGKTSNIVPVAIENAGTYSCGIFVTSKDANNAFFNGITSDQLRTSTITGSLNASKTVASVECSLQQLKVYSKDILRTVKFEVSAPGSMVAGQSYPAQISHQITDISTPCSTFGCPTLEWKNTPTSSDVRVESISGNTYRFVYSNVLLTPPATAGNPSKGNLSVSGDITVVLTTL
jgi:hypothetical protein